jgi:hypothetical protein
MSKSALSTRSTCRSLFIALLIVVSRQGFAAADMIATKSNNVGGVVPLSSGTATWTWTWVIKNQGDASITLRKGQSTLSDFLPNSNISYGTPSFSLSNVTVNSGSINCSINESLRLQCLMSNPGTATWQPGGEMTVTLQATASASGAYVNPRAGTDCYVDGFAFTPEDNDSSNNTCANTVTVTTTQADLTVTKSNSVSGQSSSGGSWTWSLQILNSPGAGAAATFATSDLVLRDQLPNTNVTYGTPTVTNAGGSSGTLTCSITNFDLLCTAASNISIPASGTITVAIPTTANAEAIFVNPRPDSDCAVDPDNHVSETSDANNACSNTVTALTADMIVTKTNNVGGLTPLGDPSANWTWSFAIENIGSLSKTYESGQQILYDALPDTNISYPDAPVVSVNENVVGGLNCDVTSFVLRCYAAGNTTFNNLGLATVTLNAQATQSASYANPRPSGSCYVNGLAGIPNDYTTSNDTCADTVIVTSPIPDLSVVKTNDVAGQSVAGGSWTWTLVMTNSPGAGAAAIFTDGQKILIDNLPDTAIVYGTPTVTIGGGTSGTVNCTIINSNLSCTATGTVSVPASGTITVTVLATASDERVHANPRSGVGMQCAVDPDSLITETNDGNNACSNSVTTQTADMSITKTNSVGGQTSTASPIWTWTLVATNNGTLAKTYPSGVQIIRDALPNSGIGYGTP